MITGLRGWIEDYIERGGLRLAVGFIKVVGEAQTLLTFYDEKRARGEVILPDELAEAFAHQILAGVEARRESRRSRRQEVRARR